MSLYSEYIREHHDDGIIEIEDVGFASYRFLNEGKSVYLVDIFVRSDFRKTNVASKMADEVIAKAKNLGATELLGSVVPSAKNSTDSLRVLLAYGMKLKNSSNDLIIFRKDI